MFTKVVRRCGKKDPGLGTWLKLKKVQEAIHVSAFSRQRVEAAENFQPYDRL